MYLFIEEGLRSGISMISKRYSKAHNSYPNELRDLHNDYPLAPEKMKISSEMLSSYCRELSEKFDQGTTCVTKLIPNLQDKEKYVVHYRNLKQYLSLGMKLT